MNSRTESHLHFGFLKDFKRALTLHHSVMFKGRLVSVEKDSVVVDPDELRDVDEITDMDLAEGTIYILEITSGEKAGVIQEISS